MGAVCKLPSGAATPPPPHMPHVISIPDPQFRPTITNLNPKPAIPASPTNPAPHPPSRRRPAHLEALKAVYVQQPDGQVLPPATAAATAARGRHCRACRRRPVVRLVHRGVHGRHQPVEQPRVEALGQRVARVGGGLRAQRRGDGACSRGGEARRQAVGARTCV